MTKTKRGLKLNEKGKEGSAVGGPLSHFTVDRLDKIVEEFARESRMVVNDYFVRHPIFRCPVCSHHCDVLR